MSKLVRPPSPCRAISAPAPDGRSRWSAGHLPAVTQPLHTAKMGAERATPPGPKASRTPRCSTSLRRLHRSEEWRDKEAWRAQTRFLPRRNARPTTRDEAHPAGDFPALSSCGRLSREPPQMFRELFPGVRCFFPSCPLQKTAHRNPRAVRAAVKPHARVCSAQNCCGLKSR